MGKDSKIQWTDHTFNPWVGCQKVSPACAACYAESWAKRTGQAGLWRAERRRTSVANWREPLRWHRAAFAQHRFTGVEPTTRVFCASLADVFEHHEAIDPQWRADLWELIEDTKYLTWLLLTKRPENVRAMAPSSWIRDWPDRVWLGTTVEDQQRADERIPHLLRVPAAVRFLSCEPLLGPLDLSGYLLYRCTGDETIEQQRCRWSGPAEDTSGDDFCCPLCGGEACPHATYPGDDGDRPGIGWVIAGGESGPKARPSHPDWFRSLRDQCNAAGVPFFFKQWGEWGLEATSGRPESARLLRVGKKAAGRLLDGIEHSAFPGSK